MSAYDGYNAYGYSRPEIADHDGDFVYVHDADDERARQKVEGE